MAAPSNPLSGINAFVTAGGNKIGAQTDCTLNLPAEVEEIATKNDFGWQESLPSVTEWSLETGNLLKDSANAEPFLSNDQADRTSVAVGGTNIPKLTSVDVTLTQEVERVSTHSDGLTQSLYLGERNMELSIEGLYLDPAASSSQIQTLLDARSGANRLSLVVTIDQFTLSGDFSLGDFTPMDGAGAEASPISFSATFNSAGEITTGGTDLDASVMTAFNSFFSQTKTTSLLELHENGSAIDGSTYYEGDGYFTEVSFTAEAESAAEMSATIDGDRAITTATVSTT